MITFYTIGESFESFSNIPVVGLTGISSYTDVTVGVTGTRLFIKEFKYTTDGVNYSDWLMLDNTNLLAIVVQPTDTFLIKYRYTRSGTDTTGVLQWDGTTLITTSTTLPEPSIYANSVFAEHFTHLDSSVLQWAINVLDKVYRPGIVAEYIVRDYDPVSDEDYIKFWRSITIFFSYFVHLMRSFENFRQDANLAAKFIENNGGYLCGDETLDQLLYIIDNHLRIRAQRGSQAAIDRSPLTVDGEMLRLMCQSVDDFFLLANCTSKYNSWNVSNSSPCYRGSLSRTDLNLSYEDSQDILDKNLYPLLQSTYSSVVVDGAKSALKINTVPASQIAGIGASTLSKAILIDPHLDFEITFYVRQPTLASTLTFGIISFDIDGNVINNQSIVSGLNSNYFFTRKSLNRNDKYYFVRGIVYNYLETLLSATQAQLNIGFGECLRFNHRAHKIIPYIVLDNSLGGGVSTDINLWNVKVAPLSNKYSRCFLNNKNFIDIIAHNNNKHYTDDQIDLILRDKFIPHDTSFKRNSIFTFTQYGFGSSAYGVSSV